MRMKCWKPKQKRTLGLLCTSHTIKIMTVIIIILNVFVSAVFSVLTFLWTRRTDEGGTVSNAGQKAQP